MNPRVKSVSPQNDYLLAIVFDNNEHKIFDLKPYLSIGMFKELNDIHKFNTVRPFMGTVQWSIGLDLCPDMLYLESISQVVAV